MVDSSLDVINHDDCIGLLRCGELGRLALDVDGAPAIVPVSYRLVETANLTWIVVRSRAADLLGGHRVAVAFEIDHVDPLTHEGWSVLVRGMLLRVDDEAAMLGVLFERTPWLVGDGDCRLVIEPVSVSGRRFHVEATAHSVPPRFFHL